MHSPIVDAILDKWTNDDDTKSALIEWLESILNGSNIDSIPSLKLSGLDHQIRDGFIMHVLPLLLRRKDVHVHLTSRAHRQTTYDLAVSVAPTSFGGANDFNGRISDAGPEDQNLQQRHLSRESKHHLMAFQATKNGASVQTDAYPSPSKMSSIAKPFLMTRAFPDLVRTSSNTGSISTAITSPISNRTPSRPPVGGNTYTSLSAETAKANNSFPLDHATPRLMTGASPALGDDLSVASSVEDETADSGQSRQSSIMGSISGAFGLLSRRRPPPAENEHTGVPSNNNVHSSIYQTPERATQSTSSGEEHSHHRVVSAPPGKIGITFVEYRGHAMISNVSDESPLAGWVFPSDVLIAIDDIPVSGHRTKDIVKLLTNKAGQQRNLRVVSAVAMNEPGTV